MSKTQLFLILYLLLSLTGCAKWRKMEKDLSGSVSQDEVIDNIKQWDKGEVK